MRQMFYHNDRPLLWPAGVLLGMVSMLSVPLLAVDDQDDVKLTDVDGATTQRVARLIAARHFEKQPIDDAVSLELFDDFLNAWDPSHLYLTKSDVEEFSRYRTQLDDQIKAGQLDFPQLVFERFLSRCQAAQSMVNELIDAEHDFTQEESTLKDGGDRAWADTPADLQEYWRQTIKRQLLGLVLDGQSADQARATLRLRYQTTWNLIAQTDGSELLELYLSTMMRCLDPHSRYFSPRSEDEFQMDMSLKLVGIGARLRHDSGNTVVAEIVPGGAAAADGGLRPEDTIVAVGQGKSGPVTDIVGLKLASVVEQIRGAEDTFVRLHVKRAAADGVIVLTLKRQQVELQDQQVSGQVIDSAKWIDGPSQKIGVLTIPSFYRDFRSVASSTTFRSAARDTRRILSDFRQQKVDAVVVDIRNNTGGALAEAVEVTGLFIPSGPVVQMTARDMSPEVLNDEDTELAWQGPLVVLINRHTASASEIFAAAVKDYRRGIVVGDSKTHGKGSVQNIIDIRTGMRGPDQGAIKLTIGAWHGVSGGSSQVTGVPADVVLPSDTDVDLFGEGSLEHPIANTSTRQLSFLPFQNLVTAAAIKTVQQKSAARVEQDADFQRTQARMQFVANREQQRHVSLNLQTRQTERQQWEDLLEGVESSSGDDLFARDFYHTEVVRTTVDFLNILARNQQAGL
ncbi:MAG: carboxy terminal-processing peptidase [Planctomycetaceae bacterium]|nr:carboxy terminal-processing peptidase [Planctomycetaceae bacterium]